MLHGVLEIGEGGERERERERDWLGVSCHSNLYVIHVVIRNNYKLL